MYLTNVLIFRVQDDTPIAVVDPSPPHNPLNTNSEHHQLRCPGVLSEVQPIQQVLLDLSCFWYLLGVN